MIDQDDEVKQGERAQPDHVLLNCSNLCKRIVYSPSLFVANQITSLILENISLL